LKSAIEANVRPRQEARLQILVCPFDDAFGFGVAWLAQDAAHAQSSGECREAAGERRLAAPPAADRALVVIDALARHATEIDQTREMAGQEVVALARRDHSAKDRARIAGHSHDHREAVDVIGPDRDIDCWEPQIPLGKLAGPICCSSGWIGRQIHGPKFLDPVLEDRDAAVPADPLGDDRGRHPRVGVQEFADRRLERIDRGHSG
jgi:hypothetical protein